MDRPRDGLRVVVGGLEELYRAIWLDKVSGSDTLNEGNVTVNAHPVSALAVAAKASFTSCCAAQPTMGLPIAQRRGSRRLK